MYHPPTTSRLLLILSHHVLLQTITVQGDYLSYQGTGLATTWTHHNHYFALNLAFFFSLHRVKPLTVILRFIGLEYCSLETSGFEAKDHTPVVQQRYSYKAFFLRYQGSQLSNQESSHCC